MSRKSLTGMGLLTLASVGLWPASAEAQTVEYYHLDAVGNVLAITDTNGTVVEEHDYYPFGEECTTAPCASRPGTQTKRFTGKERDNETGLDYFGARYYGSRIGRFTTTDPVYTWQENLVDPQRWNRYAYVRNNPLRYVDPDGRVIFPAIAVAWAIYEVGSQIYDGYTAYQTVTNPNATNAEIGAAVGGFAIGAIAPGGGYGTAGKAALGKVDDVADAARALDNAAAGGRTLKVGPHAGEAIPARGPQRDFTAAERADMNRIGGETGCHTCGNKAAGTRSGNFVPDHQPPSKINKGGAPQELRPHCIGCSRSQGGEVTKTLRDEKK